MKLKVTLLLCLLALVMVVGCSNDDDNGVGHDSTLVGTWDLISISVDGVPGTLPEWVVLFNADGTGIWTEEDGSENITWSTNGTQLSIAWVSDTGPPLPGPYTVSGDIFTWAVYEPDDPEVTLVTYTRRE